MTIVLLEITAYPFGMEKKGIKKDNIMSYTQCRNLISWFFCIHCKDSIDLYIRYVFVLMFSL